MVRIRHSAQNCRSANELWAFAQAFETYAMKKGTWPPNVGNGAVPTGMSGEFRHADWMAVYSPGGRWNWDYRFSGVTVAISTVLPAANDAPRLEIDAKLDDGNLASGNFRKLNGRYSYILQK